MMTAIGQGKTQISPYHMTLISAAIANGWTLMKPYLVDHTENYTGTTVMKNVPETYETLMTSEEAAKPVLQPILHSFRNCLHFLPPH